jgi:3-dehydroquinate synthase
MIGAFHQPQCVIIDTDTLDTLEDRQLYAGLAEIIKYGLIIDAPFFAWLEDNLGALLARDKAALAYAIRKSCEIKAAVVAADEHEKGQRALLNLGHTFGHAIETATGYGQWLHGEAVACGMLLAVDLSSRMGWLDTVSVQRTRRLIERSHLPTHPPANMSVNQFLELMSVDKKVLNGQLRLVLLKSIGKAVVSTEFSTHNLNDCLQQAIGDSMAASD